MLEGSFSNFNYLLFIQIKESLGIPVVANGDIKSEADVQKVRSLTGVDGM